MTSAIDSTSGVHGGNHVDNRGETSNESSKFDSETNAKADDLMSGDSSKSGKAANDIIAELAKMVMKEMEKQGKQEEQGSTEQPPAGGAKSGGAEKSPSEGNESKFMEELMKLIEEFVKENGVDKLGNNSLTATTNESEMPATTEAETT